MKLILKYLPLLFLALAHSQALWAQLDTTHKSPENWIIEDIECAGNEITSCSVIRDEVYLRPGDSVDEEEIQNAQLRLKALGLFYDVQISLKKAAIRGQVILLVEVIERSGKYVNLNSNISLSADGKNRTTRGSIFVGDRNLLGLGKRLEVGYSQTVENTIGSQRGRDFSLKYEDPNLFGNSKYFGKFGYTRSSSGNSEYEYKNRSYEFALGRRIFDFSYIQLSHGISQNSYSGLFDSSNLTLDASTLSNTLEYGWNTKDDLFFPTSGSTLALGVIASQSQSGEYNSRDYFYFLSNSLTRSLLEDYYLDLSSRLFWRPQSQFVSENPTLMVGAQVSKYFTLQRAGTRVPDKMKIFGGINLVSWQLGRKALENPVYSTGVSYLIDNFGEISLNLDLQGAR